MQGIFSFIPATKADQTTAQDFASYFVSGCNHAGEIEGVGMSGFNVGASVSSLDKKGDAIEALKQLRGSPVKVFIDSGAFSEVSVVDGRLQITDRISDKEWSKRIWVYYELARELRSQLYVVAPDCVGDQKETLRRMGVFRDEMRHLATRYGVSVIAPVQVGDMTMGEMDRRIGGLFDFDYIRGIPSKKGAATVKEIGDFCESLACKNGVRLHLLGIGPYSGRYKSIMGAIPAWVEGVTCDSVRLTALVGRTNGANGGARVLTAARDMAVAASPDLSTRAIKSKITGEYFSSEAVRVGLKRAATKGKDDE